jgi:D-sedoheptulose 7-phosphate isomerase
MARIRDHFTGLARAAQATEQVAEAAAGYADMVRDTLAGGGKLLFAGNGGSAAAAEHIATEYVIRLRRDRKALPALALTGSIPMLSAAANDLGYERVFARALEAHGRPGDLLVLHSTSGNSPNLLEAAAAARDMGVTTVALLDRDGGRLGSLVDLAIRVPADEPARVQELQLAVEHAVAEVVEAWIAADGVHS